MKSIRDEKCRNELIERINALTPDAKAAWGKMNVEQMLSHLVQSHEMPFSSNVPDQSNWLSRTILKPLVVYILPVPKDVKVSRELDQQEEGRPPVGFDADKVSAIEGLTKVATLPLDYKCFDHPFFGKMSASQWGLLAHKHIDHHLRQFGA